MALLLQATGNVDAELEHGRKCGNDGLLFEPQDVAPVHVPGGNWSQVGGRSNDRARLIQPPLTRSLYRPLIVLNVFCLVATICDLWQVTGIERL